MTTRSFQFTLRGGAIAVACVALAAAAYRDELCTLLGLDDQSDSPMQTIATKNEFEQAIVADRAVFFLDVDWSISARQSREVVYHYVRTWRRRATAPRIEFY